MGGIQWCSKPTSPSVPLMKIDTDYLGFSGLSNTLKISSGGDGENCKKKIAKNKSDSRLNCIFKDCIKGLASNIRFAILILGLVKFVRTCPSK